jgi:peptide-methionine (S)-S-oxide reductase
VLFSRAKRELITPDQALPGRDHRLFAVPAEHAVLGTPLEGPWPDGYEVAYFALGCFWGAERLFWQVPGVYSTAVGYAGGHTPNPTYEETCTGRTGHTETVQVVYDPKAVSYPKLLKVFLEGHDPTQGFRQGNDVGTQYRSAAYWTTPGQQVDLERAIGQFSPKLVRAGFGPVTTETGPAGPFYYAEDYHQQYLYKVPGGYCGLGGTGVSCPVGVAAADG